MRQGFAEPTELEMELTDSDADSIVDSDDGDNNVVESEVSSDSNSFLPMLEMQSVASDTSLDIGKILHVVYERCL
jgi:hypothetical protein